MIRQLFSLQHMRRYQPKRRQFGISIVESMLVFPVVILLGAGILHVALIAQGKSNLEYAALMAARIASSTPNFGLDVNGQNLLVNEVMKRMRASDQRNSEFSGLVDICILRPSNDAFIDHGSNVLVPGSRAIPNANLPFLSRNLGGTSNLSVQDANILHLRVSYLYDTNVPFMNTFQVGGGEGSVMIGHEPGREPGSGSNGIWIHSDAVVVMQTPALLNPTTERYIQGTASFVPCR